MELHELKRGDMFEIINEDGQSFPGPYKFDHIDGMYSVCYLNGDLVHVVAWAEVRKIENKKEGATSPHIKPKPTDISKG